MGDYMFLLESHLSADQYRVVGQMRELAGEAAVPVFLTGGAMRDTLGGLGAVPVATTPVPAPEDAPPLFAR